MTPLASIDPNNRRFILGLVAGLGVAGVAMYLASGGSITTELVERWSKVLRVDPFVLLVCGLMFREWRRGQADMLALMRSLRDEVMIANGRLAPPEGGTPKLRGERPG